MNFYKYERVTSGQKSFERRIAIVVAASEIDAAQMLEAKYASVGRTIRISPDDMKLVDRYARRAILLT